MLRQCLGFNLTVCYDGASHNPAMPVSRDPRFPTSPEVLWTSYLAMDQSQPGSPGEALWKAVMAGDIARVETLVGKGLAPDTPSLIAPHLSPLGHAVRTGNADMVRTLVGLGARGMSDESLIPRALGGGHGELATFLLKAGVFQTDEAFLLETCRQSAPAFLWFARNWGHPARLHRKNAPGDGDLPVWMVSALELMKTCTNADVLDGLFAVLAEENPAWPATTAGYRQVGALWASFIAKDRPDLLDVCARYRVYPDFAKKYSKKSTGLIGLVLESIPSSCALSHTPHPRSFGCFERLLAMPGAVHEFLRAPRWRDKVPLHVPVLELLDRAGIDPLTGTAGFCRQRRDEILPHGSDSALVRWIIGKGEGAQLIESPKPAEFPVFGRPEDRAFIEGLMIGRAARTDEADAQGSIPGPARKMRL